VFPSCQNCGSKTRPANANEKKIFGNVSMLPGMMTWKCPNCGDSFVRPIESHQVDEIRLFNKKNETSSRKRWWQFWKNHTLTTNASLVHNEFVALLTKDLKVFSQEPFSSNTMLSGNTFCINEFARLNISYRSSLKEDPFVRAFVNAMNQAIWYKPIMDSSMRLGTCELKQGTSIYNERLRKAVLKRYKRVIKDHIYSRYL
jgi:hypothetical protein